jgi:hypothetical protein
LKVLYNSFYRNIYFRRYILEVYKRLFYLEGQEEYEEFLSHFVGEKLYSETPGMGKAPKSKFQHLVRESPWREFLDHISMEHMIPLSALPMWELPDTGKTDRLCYQPYDNSHEPEFREKFVSFLKKYAPGKIFVPTVESCFHPSTKKYNDGGEVRTDFEPPQNDWNSGFKLQSFMTQPLSKREVWLPGRIFKIQNNFWFSIAEQIVRNVPYYANNFSTTEELWESIHRRLMGYCVIYDVSGFGLQFPRSLLRIAAEEIRDFYHSSPQFEECVDSLNSYLDKVWLQYPDGSIKNPTRGIGLGYYELLKT